METTLNYAPTDVGPSKLDEVLAYCVELDNVSKEKVCLIQDLTRLGKLLEYPPLSTHNFDHLYSLAIPVLEGLQLKFQVEWNTLEYQKRVKDIYNSK
jgi:hypothetical protein